jgi:hypothetical protein
MRHELSTEIALQIRAYLEERQSIDQLLDWVLLNALGPDRIHDRAAFEFSIAVQNSAFAWQAGVMLESEVRAELSQAVGIVRTA